MGLSWYLWPLRPWDVEQPPARLRCVTLDGLAVPRWLGRNVEKVIIQLLLGLPFPISAWASPPPTSFITFADFSLTLVQFRSYLKFILIYIDNDKKKSVKKKIGVWISLSRRLLPLYNENLQIARFKCIIGFCNLILESNCLGLILIFLPYSIFINFSPFWRCHLIAIDFWNPRLKYCSPNAK